MLDLCFSNDLNRPFFECFLKGARKSKKRCSDREKRQKRKMAKNKLEILNPLI